MTTGEWSCLISFTLAPLTCSERGGNENSKWKDMPLSRMLHDILDDDHIQWYPPLIGHYTNFWPLLMKTFLPNLIFYLIVQGFHRTYATGATCQQRTLTPPDTWSCPTLGLACVLLNLSCLRTFEFRISLGTSLLLFRGIRTHTTPVHNRKVSALDRSATVVRYQVNHL